MATYRKRGSKWQYRVRYTDIHGEQQAATESGFKTKRAAELAAGAVQDKLAAHIDPRSAKTDFLDYWDRWLAAYKSGDKARITEYRYTLLRGHLAREFEGRELGSVTAIEWQTYLNDFAAGKDLKHPHERSKDIVMKLNGYVRSMVKAAINDGILRSDFTFGVHLRGADAPDKVKALDVQDFQAVMQASAGQADIRHVSSLAVYVACMTGLRVSEVLALTWPDIDAKAHLVHVTRSWDHITKRFKPTKTKSSVRDVEVSPQLTGLLSKYHADQVSWYMKTGYRDDDQMIFRSRAHQVLTEAACTKALRKIEDGYGIPVSKQVTFHGLRHSHVSYLIAKGIDIYYISKRLGHKDVTITMKVYGHLLDSRRKEEAEKAVAALDKLN